MLPDNSDHVLVSAVRSKAAKKLTPRRARRCSIPRILVAESDTLVPEEIGGDDA